MVKLIKLERPACPNPAALNGGDYKHPANKIALKDAASDKCMYCESALSHISYAHVEHIKPKSMFPDLTYVWENLGYACARCNGHKSNKYEDQTPYLDPYSDNPDDYLFASGAWLFVREGSERAEITIRDIQLNRAELLERRSEKLIEMEKALNACFRTASVRLRNLAINALAKETENDKEFSLIVKAFLAAHKA